MTSELFTCHVLIEHVAAFISLLALALTRSSFFTMNAGTQVMEDFWGVALTKNQKEHKWEADDDSDNESLFTEKSLELRQACLGSSAKEGERNVVELITDNEEGEAVTHTLLSMRVGGTEQSPLFLTLNPPVTFKLVQGNGPVHIVGQMNETIDLSLLEGEEDDEEEEEEEEEVKIEASKGIGSTISLKRPATSPSKAPAKMAKIEPVGNGAMEWDTGSEDDDEEDDDSEEDDEESDEDEEDDEEVRPTPKKAQTNGKVKNDTPRPKSKVVKTPQSMKSSTTSLKGSRSAPKVMSEKKKTPVKGVVDISEIKERLIKMSVPKKLDKFNNFVANSFKIKDDGVKKQLWEFVQKKKSQV